MMVYLMLIIKLIIMLLFYYYMLYLPIYLFPPNNSHNSSINYNWSKATQTDIQSYQDCLYSNLDMIEISDGYLNYNDPHCTNVLHSRFIEVYCHSIIKSCIKASSVSIPLFRPNVQRVPGRTNHVKGEPDRSLIWHWIWLEAGKPFKGFIYEIIKRRRYAVVNVMCLNFKN